MSLSLMATLAHAINARRISDLGPGQLAGLLPNVLVDIVLGYAQPSAEDHFAAVSATGQVIKQDLISHGRCYSIHLAVGPIIIATFATGPVSTSLVLGSDEAMAKQMGSLFADDWVPHQDDEVNASYTRECACIAANAIGWLAGSYARVARDMPATF